MLTRGHVPKGVDDVRKRYQTLRAVRQDRAHTPRALATKREQPPARKGLACEAIDFDCTNVDHVTKALWEKLTPSRTSLRSLAAIGLDNLEF